MRETAQALSATSSSNMAYQSEGWIDRLGGYLSRKRRYEDKIALSRNNIYIFPSALGFGYMALLALMLVTAINYQNSLIYLFTFTLAAIFFVSIWLCFFEFNGIEVSAGQDSHVAAGEKIPFSFRLHCGHKVNVLLCRLESGEPHVVSIDEGEYLDISLESSSRARGVYNAPRLKMETYFPFGLVRAWTYLRINATAYVYPRPEQAPESRVGGDSSAKTVHHHISDELSDIKEYQSGDPMSRMIWKHFASKDMLVVRAAEKGGVNLQQLDWEMYPDVPSEQRLNYLAHDVLQLAKERSPFSLRLPNEAVPAGVGEQHVLNCLKALARFNPRHTNGSSLS